MKLRFHVRGLSICLFMETLTNPWVSVFVQRGSLHKRPKKPSIPDSQSLTLEGNRGVRQIKQPYPVASVSACVL